ncbi:hypothetical protein [Micromonospora cremea]|uniref:hypothetical protein n=1 Tax=Micromonospora cremea TaxID=709881 RepID=UPI00117E48EF|nr:hypothetical protein [Micromonospora cremea]
MSGERNLLDKSALARWRWDSLVGAFSLLLAAEAQRLPQIHVEAFVVLRIGLSSGSAEDGAEEASGANGEDHAEEFRVIETVTA